MKPELVESVSVFRRKKLDLSSSEKMRFYHFLFNTPVYNFRLCRSLISRVPSAQWCLRHSWCFIRTDTSSAVGRETATLSNLLGMIFFEDFLDPPDLELKAAAAGVLVTALQLSTCKHWPHRHRKHYIQLFNARKGSKRVKMSFKTSAGCGASRSIQSEHYDYHWERWVLVFFESKPELLCKILQVQIQKQLWFKAKLLINIRKIIMYRRTVRRVNAAAVAPSGGSSTALQETDRFGLNHRNRFQPPRMQLLDHVIQRTKHKPA